jgi:VanZ family protein
VITSIKGNINESNTKQQLRRMNFKLFFNYCFPVVLWVGFTFWMSTGLFSSSHTSKIIEPILRYLMPHLSVTDVHVIHGAIRKLAHVTEYFILGLLLFRAFRSDSGKENMLRWSLFSLMVMTLLALGDEFHQSLVLERTASIFDVGFDIMGGFLGLCVKMLWDRARRTNGRRS